MIMPGLLLQKHAKNSKARDHVDTLEKKLLGILVTFFHYCMKVKRNSDVCSIQIRISITEISNEKKIITNGAKKR